MNRPDVSILVPTLNEAENLPLLVPQIDQALAGRSYEILIIDDNSADDTPRVCGELAAKYPLRLIVRRQPADGLSGAVLHGIAQAQGQYLVVMDADLQHPPQRIPDLLAAIEQRGGDFALGSRYAPGGSTESHWGLFRRINSWLATLLARPFAGKVHDPMSGFFALRRSTCEQAEKLTPLGYKIALELMCKCRVRNVVEVPIHFARRQRGQSKLSMREQFRYLEHLSRLYDFKFPRVSPIAKFLVVLAAGWSAGLALMGAFWPTMGALSAGPAYLATVLVTAMFHARYTLTQRRFIIGRPWLPFILISATEWLGCAGASLWLDANLKSPTFFSIFLLTFGTGALIRYILRKELVQDLRGLRREERFVDRV